MKTNPDFSIIAGINKLIHEPSRMAIISLLSAVEEADFVFLMSNTGLTQGNLSSHLAKLEEAGYVEINKTFKGKRPHTVTRLTDSGQKELKVYLRIMKDFLSYF